MHLTNMADRTSKPKLVLAPAALGNIVGGATIVSLLNYGQVVAGQGD